mmetsp:Transcript_2046/g.5059  ORF Transcript_2046/g.5059 Transcript_2046/m.5059 type:complete len:282 (-) Transcript_2046:474-1319(-)
MRFQLECRLVERQLKCWIILMAHMNGLQRNRQGIHQLLQLAYRKDLVGGGCGVAVASTSLRRDSFALSLWLLFCARPLIFSRFRSFLLPLPLLLKEIMTSSFLDVLLLDASSSSIIMIATSTSTTPTQPQTQKNETSSLDALILLDDAHHHVVKAAKQSHGGGASAVGRDEDVGVVLILRGGGGGGGGWHACHLEDDNGPPAAIVGWQELDCARLHRCGSLSILQYVVDGYGRGQIRSPEQPQLLLEETDEPMRSSGNVGKPFRSQELQLEFSMFEDGGDS